MPWFAGGASGAAVPTFGYLVGLVLAAAVVGGLARRGGDRGPLRTAGAMALGSLCVYAVGVPYLACRCTSPCPARWSRAPCPTCRATP